MVLSAWTKLALWILLKGWHSVFYFPVCLLSVVSVSFRLRHNGADMKHMYHIRNIFIYFNLPIITAIKAPIIADITKVMATSNAMLV